MQIANAEKHQRSRGQPMASPDTHHIIPSHGWNTLQSQSATALTITVHSPHENVTIFSLPDTRTLLKDIPTLPGRGPSSGKKTPALAINCIAHKHKIWATGFIDANVANLFSDSLPHRMSTCARPAAISPYVRSLHCTNSFTFQLSVHMGRGCKCFETWGG